MTPLNWMHHYVTVYQIRYYNLGKLSQEAAVAPVELLHCTRTGVCQALIARARHFLWPRILISTSSYMPPEMFTVILFPVDGMLSLVLSQSTSFSPTISIYGPASSTFSMSTSEGDFASSSFWSASSASFIFGRKSFTLLKTGPQEIKDND